MNKQEQLNEPPAPAPPPRPYDSLLLQLAVSGLTWNSKQKKTEEYQTDRLTARKNGSGQEVIWKEEKEEDKDLDAENGQQKQEVPFIVSGNDEFSSGQEPRFEMISLGNKDVRQGIKHESLLKTSGENFENYDENTEGQEMASSESGEWMESEERHVAMYNSPQSNQAGGVKQVFPESDISGGGQHLAQEIDDNDTSSDGSTREDNVRHDFPKNKTHTGGQLHNQGSGDFESTSSDSNQYEKDKSDENKTSSDGRRREDNVRHDFPKNNIYTGGQFHKQGSDDFESSSSGGTQYEKDETFSGSGE